MGLDLCLVKNIDVGIEEEVELWWGNQTHNITPMWKLAGVYDALYMSSGKQAKDVIDDVRRGFNNMSENPEKYKKLNPSNGWGSYDSALTFLECFKSACDKYPFGEIVVSK